VANGPDISLVRFVGYEDRRTGLVFCVDCAPPPPPGIAKWIEEELDDYMCDGPCGRTLDQVPVLQL
jgi:hypothetical protein